MGETELGVGLPRGKARTPGTHMTLKSEAK